MQPNVVVMAKIGENKHPGLAQWFFWSHSSKCSDPTENVNNVELFSIFNGTSNSHNGQVMNTFWVSEEDKSAAQILIFFKL